MMAVATEPCDVLGQAPPPTHIRLSAVGRRAAWSVGKTDGTLDDDGRTVASDLRTALRRTSSPQDDSGGYEEAVARFGGTGLATFSFPQPGAEAAASAHPPALSHGQGTDGGTCTCDRGDNAAGNMIRWYGRGLCHASSRMVGNDNSGLPAALTKALRDIKNTALPGSGWHA